MQQHSDQCSCDRCLPCQDDFEFYTGTGLYAQVTGSVMPLPVEEREARGERVAGQPCGLQLVEEADTFTTTASRREPGGEA